MPVSFPLPAAVDISTLIDAVNQMFADGPLDSSVLEVNSNITFAPTEAQMVTMLVDTNAPRNITIDSSTPVNTRILFKDATGLAGTNQITITPNGSVAIDGSTSPITLNVNWGGFAVVRTANGWYTVGKRVRVGNTLEPVMIMERVIKEDLTVPAGYNALSAGPVVVDYGKTVTVTPGSRWAIV